MDIILLRSTGVWLVIVVGAVLNGLVREKLLVPLTGHGLALPVSGVILSILVFLIALVFTPFIGATEGKTSVVVGIWWATLTLAFESLFGHYAMGKPWSEIIQVFNVKSGDLFVVVLITTGISPWLATKLTGLRLG